MGDIEMRHFIMEGMLNAAIDAQIGTPSGRFKHRDFV